MLMGSEQAMHYNYLVVFSLLCSYYVTDMIKKNWNCRLLVVIRFNMGTPKLVCPKSVNWCRKQSVSTPDFQYEIYDSFCLVDLCDDQCKNNFRFFKNDIFRLKEILQIPENISCANRVKIVGIEAFRIFLKRFAYPCRYANKRSHLSLLFNNINIF